MKTVMKLLLSVMLVPFAIVLGAIGGAIGFPIEIVGAIMYEDENEK